MFIIQNLKEAMEARNRLSKVREGVPKMRSRRNKTVEGSRSYRKRNMRDRSLERTDVQELA